jgi:hypothetical protein
MAIVRLGSVGHANRQLTFKTSYSKTPLLAAEGFMIQLILIQGEKAERFQQTSPVCLT